MEMRRSSMVAIVSEAREVAGGMVQERPENAVISLTTYRADLLRILGENSAVIIHELKGPLAGIRAHLQLMERQICLNGNGESLFGDRFALLYGEISRMGQLINEYLSLASQREPQLKKVDPVQLIIQTTMLLRSLCLSNGVMLETDLPEVQRMMLLDEQQIKQVLINLILNAQQACGCG
ncbi:MAG: histidine kinase dimerization/phospho-acceptor domain-containing protein, partial [Clostridiales bacterium]